MTLAAASGPSGYRSCVVHVTRGGETLAIAAGPNGCDISRDGGRTWSRASSTGFHVVAASPTGDVWAAGSEGRISRLMWDTPATHE